MNVNTIRLKANLKRIYRWIGFFVIVGVSLWLITYGIKNRSILTTLLGIYYLIGSVFYYKVYISSGSRLQNEFRSIKISATDHIHEDEEKELLEDNLDPYQYSPEPNTYDIDTPESYLSESESENQHFDSYLDELECRSLSEFY